MGQYDRCPLLVAYQVFCQVLQPVFITRIHSSLYISVLYFVAQCLEAVIQDSLHMVLLRCMKKHLYNQDVMEACLTVLNHMSADGKSWKLASLY